MRIEKRLPFGFRGDWGKVYKRYTADKQITVDNGAVIEYQKNFYVDIGQDVQFKRVNSTSTSTEQPLQGLEDTVTYISVETTDAYFDSDTRQFLCVVSPDDIVKVFGRLWAVTSVRTESKYTPAEHKFFYLELRSIL